MNTHLIETMPILFGEQLYPNGFPLPADKVFISGRTIQDIFFDTCDGDFSEDHPDVKILNDYYRYYLMAPCWDLADISKDDVMKANSAILCEMCMEIGIDPI